MMTQSRYANPEVIVDKLLKGPENPESPFSGGISHNSVFNMARAVLHASPPGMGTREVLGICCEDRAAIAAAMLAAMAGGPTLVFPHDSSDASLLSLKTDIGLTRVLAEPLRKLPEGIHPVSLEPLSDDSGTVSLGRRIDMDSPIVYLYTGGSTGKPVIWSKTITNIMAEAGFHAIFHGVGPDDVIVATVPPYHIYGLLFSVALPLISGASVVNQTCAFPHEIVTAVTGSRATILISVPPHYKALKGHDFPGHGLRLAFSSAGSLDPDDEAAFRSITKTPLLEVYGSTETGGIAFRCRARGESFFTPFDRIEARIDNNQLRIRSLFVSPEIAMDDQGFHEVQDRVEAMPDNAFSLLGRVDTVVKIAGKRVDLDHVKVMLKQVPGVRDAFVYAKPVATGRAFDIHALIEGDCNGVTIREFLSNHGEAAAHPRRIRVVDKIPMTRAGKYDKSAIEALFDREAGE